MHWFKWQLWLNLIAKILLIWYLISFIGIYALTCVELYVLLVNELYRKKYLRLNVLLELNLFQVSVGQVHTQYINIHNNIKKIFNKSWT